MRACRRRGGAVPVVQYTTLQWEWDEAKFQMKTPLRELSETISMRIAALDEELKLKVRAAGSANARRSSRTRHRRRPPKWPLTRSCDSRRRALHARCLCRSSGCATQVSELNTIKGTISAIERKTQGNLMVRGLADIIEKCAAVAA